MSWAQWTDKYNYKIDQALLRPISVKLNYFRMRDQRDEMARQNEVLRKELEELRAQQSK